MSKDNKFHLGYSTCCNDVVKILEQVPDDATKEYIIHYLFSELSSKFFIMTQEDDDTT